MGKGRLNHINFKQRNMLGSLAIRFSKLTVLILSLTTHQLSQKECAILKLLYSKRGEAVSRDEIIDEAWGTDSFPFVC